MNLLIAAKLDPTQNFNTTFRALGVIISNFQKKFNLSVLCIIVNNSKNKGQKKIIENLKKFGVEKKNIFFLEKKINTSYFANVFNLIDFFFDIYNASKLLPEIRKIISKNNIEIVFDYNELSINFLNITNVKKISYGGWPEFIDRKLKLNFGNFFFHSKIKINFLNNFSIFIKKFMYKFYVDLVYKHYLKTYEKYDLIINFNYKTYLNLKNNGFKKKTFYVPVLGQINKTFKIKKRTNKKINIIATTGNKFSLNNTLSAYFIYKYLVPEMNEKMKSNFKLVSFGDGNYRFNINQFKYLKYYYEDKGFVKNYHKEFRKNDIMLLCQNAISTKEKLVINNKKWDYHSMHARIYDAFNNGVCLIAHKENSKSMPELINGYNCLTGGSPKELAECVKRIHLDDKLRRKLTQNAYKSLNKFFNINKNLNKIANIIDINCK